MQTMMSIGSSSITVTARPVPSFGVAVMVEEEALISEVRAGMRATAIIKTNSKPI